MMNKENLNLILSIALFILCIINFILSFGTANAASTVLSCAAAILALIILIKELKKGKKN